MKKFLAILCLSFASAALWAQASDAQNGVRVPQFGYLSYDSVFQLMPEYEQARADFAALKAKYDAEATRSEEEFQRKFAEFLNGQKDFPQSIMLKRQAELQDLMDRSIAFRKETTRLLADAEKRMQEPIAAVLNQAIYDVAAERGLIYVLNTDGNAVPFVHPQVGVDITEAVKQKLGINNPQPNEQATAMPEGQQPATPTTPEE